MLREHKRDWDHIHCDAQDKPKTEVCILRCPYNDRAFS